MYQEKTGLPLDFDDRDKPTHYIILRGVKLGTIVTEHYRIIFTCAFDLARPGGFYFR